MKYSVDKIKKEIDSGAQLEYLFFWGHTPKKENIVDKSCFSQWYPASFTVDGVTFQTAEHWMMAKKALLFDDKETHDKILHAEKPAIAKALGREVKDFDPVRWNEESYRIVKEGNLHKFSQHAALKAFLLNTGDKVIVEASPVDMIWGIGLVHDAPEASNPFNWKGANLLGFALMEVRDIISQ